MKQGARADLERLCRYLGRPPVPDDRLRPLDDGRVAVELERPRKGGVRALVFEPHAVIARIAALVPPPRFHLLRDYGVFGPHAAVRAQVVPAPPDGPPHTGAGDPIVFRRSF